MKTDPVQTYQALTREVLMKRALGLLTMEDEAELAEDLDDVWRTLTKDEQQEVEQWWASISRPPTRDVELDTFVVGIEPPDTREAARDRRKAA